MSVPTVFQKPLLRSHAKFAKYAKFPLGDGCRTTEYTEYTEGGLWDYGNMNYEIVELRDCGMGNVGGMMIVEGSASLTKKTLQVSQWALHYRNQKGICFTVYA